jgi:hypothetical protein
MKSTISNSANVDALPVFLFLHALPHFCIRSRISFFLANIGFNVLAGNLSHFAMSTPFSPGFFSTEGLQDNGPWWRVAQESPAAAIFLRPPWSRRGLPWKWLCSRRLLCLSRRRIRWQCFWVWGVEGGGGCNGACTWIWRDVTCSDVGLWE